MTVHRLATSLTPCPAKRTTRSIASNSIPSTPHYLACNPHPDYTGTARCDWHPPLRRRRISRSTSRHHPTHRLHRATGRCLHPTSPQAHSRGHHSGRDKAVRTARKRRRAATVRGRYRDPGRTRRARLHEALSLVREARALYAPLRLAAGRETPRRPYPALPR